MPYTGTAPLSPPSRISATDPDPVAVMAAREAAARAAQVRIEKAKILRERVKACYKEAGVNHLQDCKDAVDAYLAAIKGGAGTALLNAGPPADRA